MSTVSSNGHRTRTQKKSQSKFADRAVDSLAMDFLKNPDLMDLIVQDVQKAFNISGEEDLIRTIYLAATSRRLSDPLSLIVQGKPGSGKTLIIDSICRLLPPDDVVTATQMSPKALYYHSESIAHKVINGKERSRLTGEEAQQSTAAIRQLISDKVIVNRTVSAERQGKVQTVHGPVSYLESTTLADKAIFDEDLSRCLLMRTDSSPQHVASILDAISDRFGTGQKQNEQECDRIILKHQQIQGELLRVCPTVIPFRHQLAKAFPKSIDSAPRLFERLLFTIAASAHLHQIQRSINEDGELLANLSDYQIAKTIIDRCLQDAFLRRLAGAQKEIYRIALDHGRISSSMLVDKAGKSSSFCRTQLHLAVSVLIEIGALVVVTRKQGPKPRIVRCYELPDLVE